MRMQKGEWTQVYDLVPNKTISVKHYDELIAELTLLRKVASIAWNVVETKGMSDVLLSELAGRLADWETWKEGER